jgi:hypothetical protein
MPPIEPQHSKIIGKLLDPKERHGYGDLFLAKFFEIVLDDPSFSPENNDRWRITIEKEGRYDIRIRNQNGSKIVIIENKSNGAEDQKNQLYRYWYEGIYSPQYKFGTDIKTYCKILYLSPNYDKKPDEQTVLRHNNDNTLPDRVDSNIIKVVYFKDEIVKWLDACMVHAQAVDKNLDMYYYLKQYNDYWRI